MKCCLFLGLAISESVFFQPFLNKLSLLLLEQILPLRTAREGGELLWLFPHICVFDKVPAMLQPV